jgi:hypothetical protein
MGIALRQGLKDEYVLIELESGAQHRRVNGFRAIGAR